MGLNLEKSKVMLVIAAEDGHAMSQAELSAMLIDGNCVDSDPARGFEYLRPAANLRYAVKLVFLRFHYVRPAWFQPLRHYRGSWTSTL